MCCLRDGMAVMIPQLTKHQCHPTVFKPLQRQKNIGDAPLGGTSLNRNKVCRSRRPSSHSDLSRALRERERQNADVAMEGGRQCSANLCHDIVWKSASNFLLLLLPFVRQSFMSAGVETLPCRPFVRPSPQSPPIEIERGRGEGRR